MLPGLLVKELGVMVDSSDDSYMPKNLVVQVGNSETNLTELKSLTVPRYGEQWSSCNVYHKSLTVRPADLFKDLSYDIRACMQW